MAEDRDGNSAYLRIDRVSKRFDETLAVDDVSLDIRKHEIFALLGSSGCGKTTLLRMLAGLETPGGGPHRARWPGLGRRARAPAADEHDVPVVCAIPAPDR